MPWRSKPPIPVSHKWISVKLDQMESVERVYEIYVSIMR
jgi:hypothetical protein